MNKKKEILIVGAGPSGLSTAIFLSELGYRPKIIDKKTEISVYSKALGVNPRTLELFEPFGITEKFLSNGRRMNAINIWRGDQHILKNDFQKAKHKYPFMLIQAQKESEEILLDELQKRGIKVEYGSEFTSLQTNKNQHKTKASIQENARQYEASFDCVVGADGGRSRVRELSGIEYEGLQYDEEWELYDVELETELNRDEGHIRLFPEGAVLMIRLKGNVWRVAGRMNSILNYLPKNTQIGEISWESKFRIHHKIAQKLTWENIAIIGDAAHLHSPVGARGMNLGIEDAYVLSKLIHEDSLNKFNEVRRPYISQTVNRINRLTMALAGDSRMSRTIRNNIGILKLLSPLIMPRARGFILGIK